MDLVCSFETFLFFIYLTWVVCFEISNLRSCANSENMWFWGLGAIFVVHVNQSIARKLRRLILLHFWLVTCRFHFGKTRKPLICLFSGHGGRDHDSANQYYLSLGTPRYTKYFKTNPKWFFKRLCLKVSNLWKPDISKMLETRVPNILKIRVRISWFFEYGINIFRNTWNWHIVISINGPWTFEPFFIPIKGA